MSIDTASIWLKFASVAVILLGALVALASHPALSLPTVWLTDLVFLPFDGAQQIAAEETRLFLAISGGVMVGWGVMMWLIATRLLPADPSLARLLFIEGTLAWYLVDTTGSFLAGGHINMVLNTGLMLMIVYPAWSLGRVARPAGA
ncbi:hypothetical protein [Rhizobium sp. AAP43]|uniref:hypothetical protein n=1 Tax=Rhizobium sp. AAP43 TaxID=1523420 RepID=UPI0006B921C6|nr:hypothetical protein [Rhizobium sp. AAP43]KPF43701.1 hypothetical protein IP76_12410 [Rhizobium sp. AAP43]